MEFSLKMMLIGLLVGAICVGGLQTGLRILLKTQENDSLLPPQKRLRMTLAGSLLIGQLVISLWVLFRSGVNAQNAMSLGGGLVVGTFLFSLVFNRKDEA